MKKLILVAVLCAALAGCATAPQAPEPAPVVTTVDKPVPVPCKVPKPERPAFAFDSLPFGADIYTQVATLLADRKQRQGYEVRLEAAVDSCQ
ncbi:hypothetical protein WT88_29690 [Burkholderia stagnalis]|uniref:hypothetical protein n=1 Tax=Burkholderia stagnalis TaxID=1503054 RepID=UPI0007577D67|nr:hypothetical protein [Burkholderia stagnalis]KVZ18655.1 hypothetical protein WT35_04630 [Burkholderia stagnalis]KWN32878.1 hypothetical protein WT86_18755 [Burkholderia stagnalis]KWN44705.1 hypothetical protein WT88_29690 [Burkholderia stagnalis]KWN54438.1 hypothetical protein WT87_03785 [Burkholderia stagnalis]KWO68845.1 hypothetical protein WT99_21155 [Burkholderia stagnalis]